MLLIEKLRTVFNNLEQKKTATRIIAFCISIVSTSGAISFAVFTKNDFFLGLDSLLAVITLSLCILPISAKYALISGCLSLIAAASTVIYGLVTHVDLLKPYLP